MRMNNPMNLFIAFAAIFVIAFFMVGFASSIPAPSNTTAAGQQYENLTNAVSITDTGLNATMILLAFAMLIAVVIVAIKLR